MPIRLYNSLNKQKENFVPIDKKSVGMYVCGPTVYDLAHIGNARSVVVFDVLYRILQNEFGKDNISYVRNITDVDDKINKRAKESNIEIYDLTQKTIAKFHENISELNCLAPNFEPKATDHIDSMIDMIAKLIEKKHAYEAEGHVLFSVKSYKKYGELSNRSYEEMLAGARVEVAPFKKDAADFVLWKPSFDSEPAWESPWGNGRPGWHIECSAMSKKYLGNDFDIHAGGADLKFPHHENEIAQSCCANEGSSYAKYWVHNGFLSVNGEKMSKSLGNFITIDELLSQNISGEYIRFALLNTHYRKPLNWTDKLIDDAKISIDKFFKFINKSDNFDESMIDKKYHQQFIETIYDDINTPKAISILHNICADKNIGDDIKSATLTKLCNIIGICQQQIKSNIAVDENKVKQLIEQRYQAKAQKNWQLSDEIRDDLKSMGINIKDNPDGTTSY